MDGRSCRCGLPRPCRWDKWVGIPPAIARAPSSHTRQRTTRSRAVDTSGVIMSTRHVTRPHISPGLPVAPLLVAPRTRLSRRVSDARAETLYCLLHEQHARIFVKNWRRRSWAQRASPLFRLRGRRRGALPNLDGAPLSCSGAQDGAPLSCSGAQEPVESSDRLVRNLG